MTRPIPSRPDRQRAGGALARALLTLGVILFPLGLWLPLMETTRFLVFRDSYSILDTLRALWREDEMALALLIAVFALLTPVLKACALVVLHRTPPGRLSGAPLRALELLGKWSLTDVLVVALIIVMWTSSGLGSAASLPGLWIFAASAVCLMLASGLIVAAHEACAN